MYSPKAFGFLQVTSSDLRSFLQPFPRFGALRGDAGAQSLATALKDLTQLKVLIVELNDNSIGAGPQGTELKTCFSLMLTGRKVFEEKVLTRCALSKEGLKSGRTFLDPSRCLGEENMHFGSALQ